MPNAHGGWREGDSGEPSAFPYSLQWAVSFIAKLVAGAAFGAMRRANDLVIRVPRDILDRILGCHTTFTVMFDNMEKKLRVDNQINVFIR